jgi:hypothetical protein
MKQPDQKRKRKRKRKKLKIGVGLANPLNHSRFQGSFIVLFLIPRLNIHDQTNFICFSRMKRWKRRNFI